MQKSSWCSRQPSHTSALSRQPSAAQDAARARYVSSTCVTRDIKKLHHQRLRFNEINKMCSFLKTILVWAWPSPRYRTRMVGAAGECGDGQCGLEWPPWWRSASSSVPTVAFAPSLQISTRWKQGNNVSVLVWKHSWPCGLHKRVSGTLRGSTSAHSENRSLEHLARCLVHSSYFNIWLLSKRLTETSLESLTWLSDQLGFFAPS